MHHNLATTYVVPKHQYYVTTCIRANYWANFSYSLSLKQVSKYLFKQFSIHRIENDSAKPLYTDRLFHRYMLDESICHLRCVLSILLFLFCFWWKILLVNNVDPDQMPH